MSVSASVLAKQLAEDKNVVLINSFLDKAESTLVLRGTDAALMVGDYQNTLTYHSLMLDNLFKSDVCDKERHIEYLSKFDDMGDIEVVADGGARSKPFASIAALFSDFKKIIAEIELSEYPKVFAEVRKTTDSRINYFKGLRQALPIGRVSYPSDVAWFHRRNEALLKHYLSEHTNDPLSQPELAEVKKECDFKESKEQAVQKIIEVIRKETSMKTPAFFPVVDLVKCDAKNYFSGKLEERLHALVNNSKLRTNKQFYEALAELKTRFEGEVKALKPSSDIAEERAVAGVKLIQSITTDLVAVIDSILIDLTAEDLRSHVMISPLSL